MLLDVGCIPTYGPLRLLLALLGIFSLLLYVGVRQGNLPFWELDHFRNHQCFPENFVKMYAVACRRVVGTSFGGVMAIVCFRSPSFSLFFN
jgi:hypothetical protein